MVEAAALAHDLGHPPFGHIAEAQLDKLLRDREFASGFEGNPQSFRIVTKLAVRRDEEGLNLTRATLNAILKYPWQRATEGPEHRKWNYYPSEVLQFNFAREEHGGNKLKSVEAELMDWSDDIAYAVHDVEDFYRAGLIPLDRLAKEAGERERFLNGTFERWHREGYPERHPESDLRSVFEEIMSTHPITEPFSGSRHDRALVRGFTSNSIGRYQQALRLDPDAPSRVHFDEQLRMEINMWKELPWFYVINNPGLATQQHGQRELIKYLFEAYLEASEHNRTMFPVRYREELEAIGGADERNQRLRIVADFISGLTEFQAVELYKRLTGVSLGSVLDAYVR